MAYINVSVSKMTNLDPVVQLVGTKLIRCFKAGMLKMIPFSGTSRFKIYEKPLPTGRGGGSSIVKVHGDVPPTRVYFFGPLV